MRGDKVLLGWGFTIALITLFMAEPDHGSAYLAAAMIVQYITWRDSA